MEGKVLTIKTVKNMEELIKLNKDLAALMQQKIQHVNALKVVEELLRDTKNKKIKYLFMPAIGGIMARVNADDQKLKKIFEDKQRQFQNAIKGIDGQIANRQQNVNEDSIRAILDLTDHCYSQDLEIPKINNPYKKK
jgi:hypothetical protein